MGEPTPRQREVWDAIVQFREQHDGKSPSFRELAALIGVSSTNAVSDFVEILVGKGWLRRDPGSRGLTPIGPAVVSRVSEARREATHLALDVLVEAGLVTDPKRAAEVLLLGER